MGIPRAIAGFVAFLFWILSLQLVAKKGGDYLILISFGSTIWTVTSSINESINRSLVTLFSYFLGKNRWTLVWKSLKSGIILLSLIFCFLSIPFVLFNRELIHLIIGTKITGITKLYLSLACYWLWIFFFIEGIGFLSMALLTALKETLFIMKLSIVLNLLLIYVPFYLAFQLNNYEPDKIWMILSMCAIATLFFNALKIRTCYLNSQFSTLAGGKN